IILPDSASVTRLQWGHPRKRVEGLARYRSLGQGPPWMLQWGHPRKRVEGDRDHSRVGRRRSASMGPPPKEGGRVGDDDVVKTAGGEASMGSPPKEGGRAQLDPMGE